MSYQKLVSKDIRALAVERPYALQVIQTQILYDIAGMMEDVVERLRRVEEALKRPRGFIFPFKVTVEKLEVIDVLKLWVGTPLYTVSIYNDGPDDVYPSVNEHQKHTPLKPGEMVSLDYQSPRIKRLYLDVDKGKKAGVRGFGVF